MIDALKTLFENDVVSQEVRAQIEEAWEAKIVENRRAATAELREEFAQKYEHDKATMVEAIDQMLSERLAEEIQEFSEDRKQLAEAKAKYAVKMRENAELLKGFVVEQLQTEIQELRADKRAMAENYAKLEEFVVEALSSEIAEFNEDKKDLAETKVRLVREAKTHFAKVKKDFIERSATAVSEMVGKSLKSEITAPSARLGGVGAAVAGGLSLPPPPPPTVVFIPAILSNKTVASNAGSLQPSSAAFLLGKNTTLV